MKNFCTLVFSFLILLSISAQTKTDTVYINGELFLQRDVSAELKTVEEHIDKDVQPHSHQLWAYYLSKPHPAVATVNNYFEDAAAEFDIPVDILKTIGQIENNWTQMGPSIDQGWGIMHLVQNDYCNTLHEAARLLKISDQTLKDDARQNIRGAAALLRHYFNEQQPALPADLPEHWYPAVKKFSGLISDELRTIQADRYYSVLKDGAHSTTLWNEEVVLERHTGLDLNYIAQHFNQNNNGAQGGQRSSDYGPAVSSLTTCNYSSGRNHSIDTWVNHWIGTGTAAGAVSWFQNCSANASAHFVTANNGTIYQVVPVANTAWHCGASGYPYNNGRSIGEEHEATNANPGLWNSTAMLQASAQMACYFCNQYGIATNQNHTSPGICGHQNMPGTNTDCPGTIPWTNWFNYFNTGSCNAVAVLPPNDYCGNEVPLTVYGNTCGGTTAGDINGATQSTAPIACGGYTSTGAKDVWFKFTATATVHDITVVPSAGLDAVIDLRTGCPGTNVDCADVGGGEGATEILHATGLTVGTVYNVRVYDYSGANVAPTTTSFTICVTTPCTAPVKPLVTGSHSICQGQSTTLTVSNTCSGCTYSWSGGGTGSQKVVNATGSYTVTVTNPCGTSASDAFSVTATAPVTPAITISATNTTICAGASVTFTATPTNGGSTPVYSWKKNGITAGTNSPAYTTTLLNHGDVVQCVLTSNATCASPTGATSNSITMNVTPVVTPTVSIAANTGTSICTGQSVAFTATPTNGGATPTYQWKLNNINVTTGATYTNNAVNNGDVITCLLTSSITSCVTQSTALSNSLTMAVTGSVTPALSINTLNDTLCAGQSATFTATAVGGGATPAYQWQLNGGNLNGQTGATYTSNALSTGDIISCELTTSAGCATAATTNSNTITVTVLPLVAPSASLFLPTTTTCLGSPLTGTVNATNAGSSPAYQWTINNSPIPGFADSVISYGSFTNRDTLRVEVTSNATCAFPATVVSNAYVISVLPYITPSVVINADTIGAVCTGTPVTFTATANNAGNTPTYTWYKNGNSVSGSANSYSSAQLSNGDFVYCLLHTGQQCVTADPVTSDTLVVQIAAPVVPQLTISSNQGLVICAGTSVQFNAAGINGGINPIYTWQVNGTNVASGNSYTTSSLANGDIVSCNMASSLGCVANSGLATSNPLQLIVSSNATPAIQKNGCELAADFIPNVAYQWYVNNNNIPGAVTRFYTANQSGYYYVIVADSNFCTNQSADIYVAYPACLPTGVSEVSDPSDFSLYPSGNGTWRLRHPNYKVLSVLKVFDALGREVESRKVTDYITDINLTHLPAGVYLLQLSNSSNWQAARRIIKM